MSNGQDSRSGVGGTAPAGRQLTLGLRDGLRDGWAVGTDTTLADLVASRTKGLGMFYVLLYIVLWGRFVEVVGRPPVGDREHGRVIKLNHVSVMRYRLRFLEAFPELDNPAPLYELVRDRLGSDDDATVSAFRIGGVVL